MRWSAGKVRWAGWVGGALVLIAAAAWWTHRDGGRPVAAGPANWVVGNGVPRGGVVNLHGRPVALARGKSGTVVILMATWCLYCAYLDRYDVPVLARTPGLVIDIVDTDVGGGIAQAGPISPAFGGLDHVGLPETMSQEQRTMATYAHRFGLNAIRNAHLYVATPAAQHVWAPGKFPTLIAVDPAGEVVDVHPGTGDVSWAVGWLTNQLGLVAPGTLG